MANTMKLTKAELNQLLFKPLSKGALKKINMVSLLFKGARDFHPSKISSEQAVSLLNMIENTDFGVLDLDGTDYDQIDSLVEDLKILSGDDSESEATEVSSDADLDELYEVTEDSKEEIDDSCTVGGVDRKPDSTPEFLKDKSPEDHALMQASIVAVQSFENEVRINQLGKEPCMLQDYSARIEDGIVVVTNHQIRSAWHYAPETEICTPVEFKKEGGLQAKSSETSRKGGVRGHQKNSMRQAISDLIETGEYSTKEIAEKIVEEMDRKKCAVLSVINSAKNPEWNSLRTCICEQDGKLLFDDDSRVIFEEAKFHKNHPFLLVEKENPQAEWKNLIEKGLIKERYHERYQIALNEMRTLTPLPVGERVEEVAEAA